MSSNWATVKSLLEECLDQPASERERFLEKACADPQVREEVLSLLGAHEDATDFLEDAGPSEGHFLSAFQSSSLTGQRIGPYRLEEEVGRGGMGTVYRAVRDDEAFRMVVAIKIVSRGMDTDSVLRRFRTERQILASLDHPNIARILDGGSTPSGLPYFVMEYVDGLPLSEFCDRQRLTVRERVNLFRKVCDAVSYAHRNHVIHRDLKPGNILVTEEGVPKLLDFGIAKIVKGGDEPTLTGLAMATPAYASPEQIRGGTIGTASDIYSLGVILYELLTGHRPYRLPLRDSDELARVICEREPTPASTVVGFREKLDEGEGPTITVDPDQISGLRRTTVDGLRRNLRGDLDTVVSVALRKEPERRYGSVEQLSDDLGRFLEGRPILARKDTFAYRTTKFAARHPVGVGAAAASLFLLCVLSVYASWEARQLSRRMAADHQLASTFLVEVHDAIANLPGATPAREKLLRKSLDYLNGLSRDAADDPEIHRALATAYEKFAELQVGAVGAGLGQSYEALETTRKAQKIREMLAARNPKDQAAQLELGQNYLLTAFLIGRASSAEERLKVDRKALEIAERLYESDQKNQAYVDLLARSHTSLAYGLTFYDRWDESRKHFRRALTLRTNGLPYAKDPVKAQRDLARIHYRLGAGYAQAGQASEAVGYLRQALAIQQPLTVAAPNDEGRAAETASSYHFLGVALRGMGETQEALQALSEAIAIREVSLARDAQNARSRSMLAGNYAERGTTYMHAGKTPEALRDFRRAVELQTLIIEVDPKGTPSRIAMADFQRRLGSAHALLTKQSSGAKTQQHWVEAAKYLRRSQALYEALAGEGLLQSPQIRSDAKAAADGAAEAARHAREGSAEN